MNLWFRQVTEELCSWSIVLDELCRACKDLGHNIIKGNNPPKFPWQWIEIWWGAPQDWQWSNKEVKARIAISLSESDQISKEYQSRAIENLNKSDVLFVTSESSKRAFLEMPIETPIYLWPLGANPDTFRYKEIDFEDNPFRFLLLGVTQFRKGSWMGVEAFVRAFENDEPVSLTVATHMESEMFRKLRTEYKSVKQIDFLSQNYAKPSRHYEDHHVLLSPHLAEGWGLCITEAMMLGMPCIVSRCSTPREYFSLDFGWWIEMSDHYVPVSGCFENTPGFWRLPSVFDMADKMRYAYEHRDKCKMKAVATSAHARKYLTWAHNAEKPLMQIEEMFGH